MKTTTVISTKTVMRNGFFLFTLGAMFSVVYLPPFWAQVAGFVGILFLGTHCLVMRINLDDIETEKKAGRNFRKVASTLLLLRQIEQELKKVDIDSDEEFPQELIDQIDSADELLHELKYHLQQLQSNERDVHLSDAQWALTNAYDELSDFVHSPW